MSTLYTYNKQQFNADVSLNGTNTVTGKTQFTSDVSLNGHITTTVDGKRFTSTSNSRFTSADTFTTFINNDKTSGDVRINTGSSGSNVIVENGNVGIGTASPQRTLTVNGLINSREIRLVDINQDISDNTTHMDVGTNSDGHYLWGYGATKPLFFGTNQSEKMRISASGNVGIGTTNPQYTLDVSGNANVSGSFNSLMYITTKIFDFNSSHVSNSQSTSKFIGKIFNGGLITVYIKSSGYDHGEGTIAEIFCGYGTQPVVRVVSGFNSIYSFYSILVNGTTYIWFNEYYHSGGQSVNYECRIYCNNPSNFYPTTTDGNDPSNATEITKGQFILGNGNVGIGTTNPGAKLSVKGGGGISGENLSLSIAGSEYCCGFFDAGYIQNSNSNLAAMRIGIANTSRSINAAGTINTVGMDYAEYMRKKDNTFTINKGDICGIDASCNLTNLYGDAHSFVVKSTSPSYVGGDHWHDPSDNAPDISNNAPDISNNDAYTAWKVRFEARRALVDRISFCGQVPVNIDTTNVKVGDFILPNRKSDGMIEAVSVSKPTFDQYQIAVGKVINILSSTQANIIVKIC